MEKKEESKSAKWVCCCRKLVFCSKRKSVLFVVSVVVADGVGFVWTVAGVGARQTVCGERCGLMCERESRTVGRVSDGIRCCS